MKTWPVAIMATGLLLNACSGGPWLPPEWVRRAYDRTYEHIYKRASHFRCQTVEARFSGYSMRSPRDCYDFLLPRRYKGIYVREFEGYRFIANAQPRPPWKVTERVWLDVDEKTDLSETVRFPRWRRGHPNQIWYVDFIGRRTRLPGGYGHMGMSEAEVLVDKMLSARLLKESRDYFDERLVVEARPIK